VSKIKINKIIHGARGISADTALRLARYFGMSVEFHPLVFSTILWCSNGSPPGFAIIFEGYGY
jgi:hypothetical protein